MRATLVGLVGALVAATTPVGSTPAGPPFDGLVAAERAFAARSVEHGMKDAFLANLCGDGIVFRPAPTNGRHAWEGRPNPKGTLRWAPRWAEVSGDGDLGVTTGPWEYATPGGGAPSYGDFVTVWKRERGAWCVAVDLGVSHDASSGDLAKIAVEPGPEHRRPAARSRHGVGFGLGVFHGGSGFGLGVGSGVDAYDEDAQIVAHATHGMMSAERTYAFESRRRGAADAFRRIAAADVRFLRDGVAPEVGVTPAMAALARRPRDLDWRPYDSGVAASGDLGYCYGLVSSRERGARADTSAFLHVWRRGLDGAWKLAVDVENPFPKR